MLTEEKNKAFILEYTKGVDLINCVIYAIDNNFCKPEDYDDYGCSIDFLSAEKSSVKDKNELTEWNVIHNNAFVKQKSITNPQSALVFLLPTIS